MMAGSPQEQDQTLYRFCLYVAGGLGRSLKWVAELKTFCEATLPGRYALRVVDVYQQPEIAQAAQVSAVPTLIRETPEPRRWLLGESWRPEQVFL